MTGTPLVAGWLAHLAFWSILALGIFTGELRAKSAGVFVALWMAGFIGLPHLGPYGGLFIGPYVGVLDVVLALAVFKGDVRLT